jgi:hypothetical protein
MQQIAKQFLKRISLKVSTLTHKTISQVAHAPNHNEWRAYIWQTKPHWEDLAWRVKEPKINGISEVHLGFYSEKLVPGLSEAIDQTEALGKGIVDHVIKSDSGIRLVWQVSLNNTEDLDMLYNTIEGILPEFLEIGLNILCKNVSENSDPEEIKLDDGLKPKTQEEELKKDKSEQITFGLFDNWIPYSELQRIEDAYDSKNELLPNILKEILDNYSFKYSGWLYDSSYQEMLENIEKIIPTYLDNGNHFKVELEELKNNHDEDESLKWHKLLEWASKSILKQDGIILKTLYPTGGEDYSCLIFTQKKLIKPIVILYHFYDAINQASGWYDDFTSSYNISYEDFLSNNNLENDIEISSLELSVEDSFFGKMINSNKWYLNITREIYPYAIAGMRAAKNFC